MDMEQASRFAALAEQRARRDVWWLSFWLSMPAMLVGAAAVALAICPFSLMAMKPNPALQIGMLCLAGLIGGAVGFGATRQAMQLKSQFITDFSAHIKRNLLEGGLFAAALQPYAAEWPPTSQAVQRPYHQAVEQRLHYLAGHYAASCAQRGLTPYPGSTKNLQNWTKNWGCIVILLPLSGCVSHYPVARWGLIALAALFVLGSAMSYAYLQTMTRCLTLLELAQLAMASVETERTGRAGIVHYPPQ